MSKKIQQDNLSVELDIKAQRAQEEIHRLTKSIENLRKQNTEHRKEITRLAATEGDFSAEINRLNEDIKNNTKEIEANKRAMETERQKIDVSRMSAADLGKELKRLKKDLANTSKATNLKRYKDLESEIRRVEKAYAQATKSTRGFLTSLLSLDKISASLKGFFMGLGMVITTYVVNAFKNMVDTIQDFERANSKLASVLGTTLDGISRLTEQAKFLGRTTTATASQVTRLQTELAKLGFSQEVIEKLTPATLKFAKAVDTDLSSAAAFAGAAMRIFNKDADAAESVMATFAVATTKSALDFNKLQASLSIVGPTAKAFGFSVEETTALLGELSNAGFDASSAATATRNILLNLADSNGALARALGAPVTNLDELVNGLRKLNTEGVDLKKALELTDKRSVSAFNTFLEQADNLLTLRDSITDCTREFNEMSKTMTNNAAGSWAGFQSAVEGLVLKFFDVREALKTVYEWGTEFINWIGSVVDALAPLGQMLSFVVGVFGSVVSTVGELIGWFSRLFTQTTMGRVVLNTLVTTLVAYKTATLLASVATKSFYVNMVASMKAGLLFVKSLGQKVVALFADTAATETATVATRAFNLALMENPITLVVSLVAMVVAAIISYCSTIDEATEKTDAWTEANREASKQYGEQKGKITALVMVAENENLSLERRKKAILELNKIIPGYNAKIDETTGKYIASKDAIEKYLVLLEKEMRYKANESKMRELASAAEEARDAYDEALIAAKDAPEYIDKWYGYVYNAAPVRAVKAAKEAYDKAEAEFKAFTARMQAALNAGTIVAPSLEEEDAIDETAKKLNNVGAAAHDAVDKLKELRRELKELRKADPQTDAELKQIEARKAAIQKQINILKGKQPKNKREPGTYAEDSIDEATAAADDTHQKKLLEINKQKGQISEADYIIKKNKELIRYCGDLMNALKTLRNATDSTHTKTLDKITAEENKIGSTLVAAQQAINKATAQKEQEGHTSRLAAEQAFYEKQELIVKEEVNNREITEDAAEIYLLCQKKKSHEAQLKELQDFYAKTQAADYISGDEKLKLLEKLSTDIRSMQSQVLTDTGSLAERIRELSTDTTSADGIKKTFDLQKRNIEDTYREAIRAEGVSADEIVALEEEKQRRIAALNYQYQEQQWQLQELTGLSWGQEYQRELAQLENYHRQGLIKEKNYQRKKLELGVNNAKKYFDYFANLSGSVFTAMQDAEIATSDAKYDVLIQQAKNNGEDTAAIEEEKENKKLEIQKKYADVNFAIKCSQIIADTAVAAMKAYADLGPIAGPVAAALITAAGIAQFVTAKAERDKIKNMSPANTAKTSEVSQGNTSTTKRVLNGYADGGYTGDGARYEVAGVVHRGEYVVPKPIMDNPKVIDAVSTIEAIRLNRIAGASSLVVAHHDGYADGGFTSEAALTSGDLGLVAAIRDLKDATRKLKRMRAYVVYSDIEKAKVKIDNSRAPFTRNK